MFLREAAFLILAAAQIKLVGCCLRLLQRTDSNENQFGGYISEKHMFDRFCTRIMETIFNLEDSIMKNRCRFFLLLSFCLWQAILLARPAQLTSYNEQKVSDYNRFYRSTADWTGVLLLPHAGRRDPEGGVWLRVSSAPNKKLVGKTLLLRWDISKPWDRWFDEHKRDVRFNPKRLKWALKVGYGPPVILDGWERVSPLESLPGNRAGELHVMLKNPVLKGETLYIANEPVEIAGPKKALVQFVGSSENNLRRVRHYNPNSGAFDGPEEIVAVTETLFSDPKLAMPMTTVEKIEAGPLNRLGWYIYGARQQGLFHVAALEPREPLRLIPDKVVLGPENSRHYLCQEEYRNLKPQTVHMTLVEPLAERFLQHNSYESEKYIDHQWPVGRKALVIHLFYGWVNDLLKKSRGRVGPYVTGHFSVGVAEVVVDPFTSEKRFDVEFWQIYGHNPQHVISNTQKWHAYCGSIARGNMFVQPMANTLIQIPELEPYAIGDWIIKPWDGLAREFEMMMALYRVGAGTGIAEIWPDTSCVQDSCAALFSALNRFEVSVAQTGRAMQWSTETSSKGDISEISRYLSFVRLNREVRQALTVFGISPRRWLEFMKEPLATRNPEGLKRLGNTLTALKTVFPRNARDHLLHVAVKRGYPMWSIMTLQIGGVIPGLRPLAPKTPTSFLH